LKAQLNFARLYYFHMVASLGSQAAAARQLRISQSTISEQIKLLENELRTQLFSRRGPQLALTEAGRKALEHSEVIFGTGERLLRDLDVVLSPRTVLEVGIAATVSRSLTSDLFLPLFRDEDTCPRVSVADFGALFPRLSSGEIHILISEMEPRGRTAAKVESVVVRNTRFEIVATPDLAAKLDSVSSLHGKPWLHFTTSSGFRWAVDSHLRAQHVVPEIVAETDDLELMRLATIRGFGFAAMPGAFIARDVEDGRLVRIAGLEEPIPLYITYVQDGVADFVRNAVDLLTRDGPADDESLAQEVAES
jgi:LysR family transcriptional activator of nhaA